METQEQFVRFNQRRKKGRLLAGLFLLIAGGILLLRELHLLFIPEWIFSWPMLLIVLGLFSGLRSGFRNPNWFILSFIGIVFLFDQINIGFNFHRFILPIVLFGIGGLLILKPRRNYGGSCGGPYRGRKRNDGWNKGYDAWRRYEKEEPLESKQDESNLKDANYDPKKESNNPGNKEFDKADYYQHSNTKDDLLDANSVFGGIKKVVYSKNFKGGFISCVFGGFEIDLMNADIDGEATIDVNLVFGGGKILVPSHWNVRIEIEPLFGGVEYKNPDNPIFSPDKLLIIKGLCLFGGLEIKSY